VPYLSASAVVIHYEEALYPMYVYIYLYNSHILIRLSGQKVLPSVKMTDRYILVI